MKKSMFYTLSAISLTIVIIVTYAFYTNYVLSQKMETTRIRIETVNFFIKDVEKDLDKGAFIAGFRTLLSFNEQITGNGTYLDNINSRFKEAFLNGTINNVPVSLMSGSTFTDWADKIEAEADKIDINFDIQVNDIKLFQDNPWFVNVGLNLTLNIWDKKNTSQWKQQRYIVTKISIIGFEDPLYVVNSNGRVTNQIIKSNITAFVTNKNVDKLLEHMNSSYYIAHNDSPDYLMRLKGNLSNSSAGIESLVNLEEFQDQGIALKDRSIVDFIYFGNQVTANLRVNNTPSWFKIDTGHNDTYQIANVTI